MPQLIRSPGLLSNVRRPLEPWELSWIDYFWDSANGVTITGSGVSSWVAMKGGATFSQGTDSARPTYANNEVTTDGSARYATTGAMTLGIPCTVIMAAKQPTWASPGHIIDGRSGGNTMAAYQFSSSPKVQIYNGASGIVAEPDSGSQWAVNTWAVVTMLWSTTAGQARIQINRNSPVTGTNASASAPSGVTIGAQPGGGQPGNASFRGIAICNSALSAAQIEQTIQAMSRRYGIAV